MNGARESANRTKCAGNLRQLMLASILYAGDWNDSLPGSNWGTNSPAECPLAGSPGWLYKDTCVSGWYNAGVDGDVTTGALWPYINNLSAYRCPLDKPPYLPAGSTHELTSYGINGAVCGYVPGGHTGPSFKLEKMRSDGVYYWETMEGSNFWGDGANYPCEDVTKRHKNGLSVSCFDGHVEWVTYEWYRRQACEPKLYGSTPPISNFPGNRLWCAPKITQLVFMFVSMLVK